MAADVKAAEFAAQLRNHQFVQNAKSAASLLGRAPGGTVTIAELRNLLNQTAATSSVLDMTGMTRSRCRTTRGSWAGRLS